MGSENGNGMKEREKAYHFTVRRMTGMDEEIQVQFNGYAEESAESLKEKINLIGNLLYERMKDNNAIAVAVAEKIKKQMQDEKAKLPGKLDL